MKKHESLLKTYQREPLRFFKAAWPEIYTWDKLEEVLDKVAKHRRVVIPAGHGVGKTWLLARIALWFLNCFPPAKVITTAPTWPQVEMLLWSEIKTAHRTSKLPFRGPVLNTEIKIRDDWFALGFSTRGKASEREFGTPKFQGFHGENLLVLLDEAPGVDHEIWISAESLIVSENNKIVAGGNPTSPSGDFYNACASPLWQKVKISSFDHPNVKENRIVVPGAVTLEWIEEHRTEWGEDSPLWFTKILGEFPAEGTDTLIALTWAEACVGLGLSEKGKKRLGGDIARFGGDMTVLYAVYGKVARLLAAVNKKDTNWTIGRVISYNREEKFDAIGIDDTGVGGGVTDGLRDKNVDVDAINFGSSAVDSDRFENLAAEIYWNLREAIKEKQIELPDDRQLINQLCSRRYRFTRKGKIALETKDEMKKRGLKSPDHADALAIAYSAGQRGDPGLTIISIDDEDV